MSTPTLTDYVTTETVMQAFSGAKDLAQAGAEATVEYYWATALADVVCCSTVIVAYLALWYMVYKVVDRAFTDKTDNAFGRFMTLGMGAMILLVAVMPICITTISAAIPVLISPEGALLYKIVTGVAQ